MNATRPAARTLVRGSRVAAAATPAPIPSSTSTAQRCAFHASTCLRGRRKPRFSSIPAKELGLVDDAAIGSFAQKHFPDLTKTERKALQAKYTPEQYEAIKLGEAAVDPNDLAVQGRIRYDPFKFNYVEDFSKIRPIVDKRVKENKPFDTDSRFMTPDEFGDDFIKWAREVTPPPKDETLKKLGEEADEKSLSTAQLSEAQVEDAPEISDLEAWKYLHDRSSMTGFGDGGDTALAPELPAKIPGSEIEYDDVSAAERRTDPEGIYAETRKHTRLDTATIVQMEKLTRIIVMRYVSNQTRLGKIRSASIMMLVGNGNGAIGIGEAKSVQPSLAMNKAKLRAIKNMMPIRRYEDRTIYGNVEAKVGGTIVKLYARPPGFGLRVSHRIFEIARAAGIKDLSAKMPRSRNPMNSVKATVQALLSQHDPEEIARGRGKKLVDARKVYYGGAVY